MYICTHFDLHELLPPKLFRSRPINGWELLDSRLLITLDNLRKKYGKITINDYYFGGEREWSGLRTPESPYYSETSQHTFGRAADCLFSDISVDRVREEILAGSNYGFGYIHGIELDVSWFHVDVRNYDGIKTFKR